MRDHAADAKVFKAFCDANRLQILELLRSGEKCACVLLEDLQISQSTLSYHKSKGTACGTDAQNGLFTIRLRMPKVKSHRPADGFSSDYQIENFKTVCPVKGV